MLSTSVCFPGGSSSEQGVLQVASLRPSTVAVAPPGLLINETEGAACTVGAAARAGGACFGSAFAGAAGTAFVPEGSGGVDSAGLVSGAFVSAGLDSAGAASGGGIG